MELGHILNNDQSREELDEILDETARMKALFQIAPGRRYLRDVLKDKVIVLLFNQPSTRTREKFELAAKYLGSNVIVITEVAYTSVVKGESWRNTIKTHARLGADAIVIRHPQNFMPHQAARFCDQLHFKTRVINAGDGNNFHPTQTIGDLFTLKEHFGEKFGKEILNVAIGADLRNARVLHSLVAGLAQYPVKLTLVSWPTFQLPRKYLGPLIENKRVRVLKETEKLREKFDLIYWVRLQTEHLEKDFREGLRRKYNQDFRVDRKFLKIFLEDNGIFMHPGPRAGEIDDNIDRDPRVKDGDQVENGVFNSMALFKMMLNPRFYIPQTSET